MKKFIYAILFIFAFTSSSANALLGTHKMEKLMLVSVLSVLGIAYTAKIKQDYHDFLDKNKGSLNDFLNTQPELREKIENTLRKKMSETKSEKLYITYQKAADNINMTDVPPFQGGDPSSKYNPEGLDMHEDKTPNKLETLQHVSDYPNYITTPIGEKIDTRLEFPFEEPENWEEYVLLKDDSKELGKNLEKAGIERPSHSAAHHVIPVNAKKSQEAIARMDKYGIKANDAENGIWLPRPGVDGNNQKSSAVGLIHNGRHPDVYVTGVTDRILTVPDNLPTEEGRKKIIDILDSLKKNLYNSTQSQDNWYNTLKK